MVDAGSTLVEPLAEVDLKVPGVMAMRVAFFVAQLSVTLEPAVMVVGLASKEEITGLLDLLAAALAIAGNPAQAIRTRINAQRIARVRLSPQGGRLEEFINLSS